MDMEILSGTILSLKTAYDIAKGAIGLKNSIETDTKIRQVLDILFTAQNDAFLAQQEKAALVKEKSALEEKIMQFETWNTEKERYQLTDLWNIGVVAYALKKNMSNGEPAHYICTNCYEDRRKSILNLQTNKKNGRKMLICPFCKTEFHSMYSQNLPINYA